MGIEKLIGSMCGHMVGQGSGMRRGGRKRGNNARTSRPSASSWLMNRLGGSGTLCTLNARPLASFVVCSTSSAAWQASYCMRTRHSTLCC
jgi:hypothetical protein